jgi:hypothetical protein
MTNTPVKIGDNVRINKGPCEIVASMGAHSEIEFTGKIVEDRGNLVILECPKGNGQTDIAYVNKKHIKEIIK